MSAIFVEWLRKSCQSKGDFFSLHQLRLDGEWLELAGCAMASERDGSSREMDLAPPADALAEGVVDGHAADFLPG